MWVQAYSWIYSEVITKVLATKHCTVIQQTTPNPWTTTASRNCFSALDLESDSEPEFDPEPLTRSHFGGEPTVPLYFGTFELEPEDEKESVSIKPQTPETESSADYLSAEERIETRTQPKSSYLNKRAKRIIKQSSERNKRQKQETKWLPLNK